MERLQQASKGNFQAFSSHVDRSIPKEKIPRAREATIEVEFFKSKPMTAQAKAKQIYDEMKSFRGTNKDRKSKARKCVKMIINSGPTKPAKPSYKETLQDLIDEATEYWNEVLTEIEKL